MIEKVKEVIYKKEHKSFTENSRYNLDSLVKYLSFD